MKRLYRMCNNDTSYKRTTLTPPPAKITVDLSAVRYNYSQLNRLSGNAECAVVLKANAYGLSINRVAPELYSVGARTFFVAYLFEAIELKQVLYPFNDVSIFVLEGNAPGTESDFFEYQISPVLNSLDQLSRWETYCQHVSNPGTCAIHVDTGMNRLGLELTELASVLSRAKAFGLTLIISHLSCADDASSKFNKSQLEKFVSGRIGNTDIRFSLSNSSGILLGEDYLFDMTRAGVALFGVNPTPENSTTLRPVIKLEARLNQVREINPGQAVGYGAAYISERPMRLGTISIGYADGYQRSLSDSNVGAYYKGEKFPLVGRVSMDSITVDLGDAVDYSPQIGDYLELVNEQFRIEDLAYHAKTIAHEIMTSLGSRLDWQYINCAVENACYEESL